MLYTVGHGQRIIAGGGQAGLAGATAPTPADAIPAYRAYSGDQSDGAGGTAGFAEAQPKFYPVPDPYPEPTPTPMEPKQVFRYMYKTADLFPTMPDAADKLDALAEAMAEAAVDQKDAAHESNMPANMTYFGQFIDHDITANTDRENAGTAFNIDPSPIAAAPRDDVETNKLNLRKGSLQLDNVYGDGPNQSPEARKLEAALRDPNDRTKMRLGTVLPTPGFERPPLPADDGADLPRIGQAIDSGDITEAEVRTLFDAQAEDLDDLRRRALIGDGRNDENLIVAQTHLSYLRYHNAVAQKLKDDGFAGGDVDQIFAEARRNVVLFYQWNVANIYLKHVCDPAVVDQVIADRAPIYQKFFDAHKNTVPEGAMPMPLEFSVAAFRFGHSMVRGDYDYNRNFGRLADGSGNGRASFDFLFRFTGDGGLRPFDGAPKSPHLPDNWIIEWDRFVGVTGLSNRVTRKIDTQVALPLKNMVNMPPGIFKHLAARNLRRGYVLNLPSAQALLASLATDGVNIPALTAAKIASGPTGAAVTAGGFDTNTPLWFYLLKEAEIGGGNHLGALGSRIVAETLIGLMVADPTSFLNQTPVWDPSQGPQPAGEVVNSISAMLRAGGLMGPGVGV